MVVRVATRNSLDQTMRKREEGGGEGRKEEARQGGGRATFSVYLNSLEVNSSPYPPHGNVEANFDTPTRDCGSLRSRDVISFFSKTRNSTTSRETLLSPSSSSSSRREQAFSSLPLLWGTKGCATRRVKSN